VDERVAPQVARFEERERETLAESVAVTFQGVTAKRGFSVRVR
jgi:hypothetical protein